MIYLDLFLGFLKVGLFAFGGAYAAIPLIRDVVLSYGWLTDDALTYMIAVSESTPGPIMVNLATYVGSSQGGALGAALATIAVALPAFVIILVVTAIMKAFIKNPWVQAVLRGVNPCVVGVILATGLFMIAKNLIPEAGAAIQWRDIGLTAFLGAVMFGAKPLLNKKVSPLMLIGLSAVLGIIVYGI